MKSCSWLITVTFIGFAWAGGSAAAAVTDYPSISGPYYWDNWYVAASSIKMMAANSHVCVLSQFGGDFQDTGDRVAVRIHTDGYWYLEGTAQQHWADPFRVHTWGDAYCFSRSLFKGQDNWLSGEFTASATFSCWFLCGQLERASNNTSVWWGDAASILNGIGGKFDGYMESVGLIGSGSSFQSNWLYVSTHADSIWGLAYSYFVGAAHSGHKLNFANGEPVWAQARKGEWKVRGLARVNKGMCYFTGVSGHFSGNNFASIDREISLGVEIWVLKVSAPDGYMAVETECVAFDQQ